jgi:hypothetical protein
LPDGLFSNQKSRFWFNWEGLEIENVVILYDHLEYLSAIWYNLHTAFWHRLWAFGTFTSVLVCLDQEKSGNPD